MPAAGHTGTPRGAVSSAPGPGFIAACCGALILPIAFGALLPRLPEAGQTYLLKLDLPVLVSGSGVLFAVLVLPLFAAPQANESAPWLTGLARGGAVAALTLPFVAIARTVNPCHWAAVPVCAFIVGLTAAGVSSAAAAWKSRGVAVAAALICLPGLIGWVALDVFPALAWLRWMTPFAAAARAAADPHPASWWPGAVPGVVLFSLAVALARRPQGEATGKAAQPPD